MRPTPTRHLVGLAGLVLAAVLVSTGTALAIDPTAPPPPSATGKTGAYHLVESEEAPAAVCSYADPDTTVDDNMLWRMAVAAPRVKAAPNRTSQKVAWRLVVQSWDDSQGAWVGYARSRWTSGTAKPQKAAALAGRAVRLHTLDNTTIQGWRAKAEIRWYGPDGTTVTGRASIWPSWYTVHWPAVPDYVNFAPYCQWTTG